MIDGGTVAAWPPAAVATVLAASLALVGTAAGTVWAVLRWRHETAREHRTGEWERACWVVEMCFSDDVDRARIGRDVAGAMYEIQEDRHAEDSVTKLVLDLIRNGGAHGVPGD